MMAGGKDHLQTKTWLGLTLQAASPPGWIVINANRNGSLGKAYFGTTPWRLQNRYPSRVVASAQHHKYIQFQY